MPEGHTLHRLAGHLNDAFVGTRPAASSPQGRFAESAAELDGRCYLIADAHGKHLFVEFEGSRWLHVHLGLIGTFTVGPRTPPVGAVRLRLATDTVAADLRGPTLCALRTPEEVQAQLGRLGPDPLRADADPDLAWSRIHRSRRSVAALLLDQHVLSGVGNVYRAEVLFRQRVDPHRPGVEVRRPTWRAIWSDLVELMAAGVRRGRIETLRPEDLDALGALAIDGEDRPLYAYRRTGQPCRVCGTPIRTELVAGRNLFWCPRCQRRR